MADAKITALTAYTTPIATDVLPIVDVTNSITKKITYSDLSNIITNTIIWIDGNRVDTYTATGAINKPYKTVSAALSGFTPGAFTGVTFIFAPAAYTEASNVVFPSLATTIQGNNATLTINSGAGNITFPSAFDIYSLNIVGNVLQTDTSITSIHNLEDGVVTGNITGAGLFELTNQTVTGTATCNSGGVLNLGFSVMNGVITNVGTLHMNSTVTVVNTAGYAIVSTTAGSVMYMSGCVVQNNSASGNGIDVRNGADGTVGFLVNELNTFDVILANATGIPVNAGIGAPNRTTNGPSVTQLNNYNATNTSGTVLYATGTSFTASVSSSVDNTGSYKDSTHSTGSSGNLLSSTTGATAWINYNTAVVPLTNKRITKRVIATTQSATPTINTDNLDVSHITGLAQAVTSFTTNLSGTPVDGDTLIIDITDNGTPRALTFGASFEASTVALPTTTVTSTKLTIGFRWNTATSKWTCVAVA